MSDAFEIDDGFVWTFPVYALRRTDRPQPLVLTAVGCYFLPLFTDQDAVRTFLERSTITIARPVILANVSALLEFLTELAGHPVRVTVDPRDNGPGKHRTFDVQALIASLRRARR